MERNTGHFSPHWTAQFIEKIVQCPEFRFAEGGFFKKLEYVCYFNLGGCRYPVHLLLIHFMQMLDKEGEFVSVQDIKFRIVQQEVHKVAAEAAIMGQDVNRVVGPAEETMDESDFSEPIEVCIERLKDFRPRHLGEVLLTSPSWCRSKYLFEAIIYHFELKEMTNEKIVYWALFSCLQKANKLKISKLAMAPLGTEFKIIPEKNFVELLCKAIVDLAGKMKYLTEITITAGSPEQVDSLKKAFIEVLNIKTR